MKAILCSKYGPPEVLKLSEVPKPVPKKSEVLIKIKATSVSVADVRIRGFNVPPAAWLPARLFLGITKPKKPILGAELSGEIEAVGSNCKRFNVGDKVYAATLTHFGGYAEYVCLSEDGPIALKPENLNFEQAAAMPIASRTAYDYLRKANLKEGQKILIYGASGSVGTYAIQIAKHMGAEVTAICSGSNLDMVKSIGADLAVDYTQPGFTDQLGTYDVVFIAIDKLPFAICHKLMKSGAVYINVTNPMKSLKQTWVSLTSKQKIYMGGNAPDTPDDITYLKELAEKGIIKPVIDKTYPLDEIVEAHRYVDTGHKKGNVVISITSG